MSGADGVGLLVALAAGIGLAAASGFRVFVPLLGVALAMRLGQIDPTEGWAWLAEPVALGVLAVAVVAEVGAYLVPWLDNALDTLATPAAVVAGTLLTALMLGDAPPVLQWVLAVVAGGGTAGVVQTGTVLARATSLGTTGGAGNPLVSIGEAVLSAVFTVLAVVVPFLTVALVIGAFLWWTRRRRTRAGAAA
ncbi:MAG TPA: DUF4126 domain-containing protein [Longimicrobiales bacterium]|nr:DUF4126 domain-containing protein [Longimicrobiales bacterium]